MASSSGTVIYSSPKTEVYNPKAVFPHAASLHQGFPHCAISPTAASRRSLGRVSVPIWPVGLSTRLPVVGTVGRHPAVYLMGRGAIPSRLGFARPAMRPAGVIRYYPRFPEAIPEEGAGSPRVTQPFATRFHPRVGAVRLACVRRAASVHPEPGSNSPSKYDGRTRRPVAIMVRRGEPVPTSMHAGSDSIRCSACKLVQGS